MRQSACFLPASAAALRCIAFHHVRLRGEGSIPVPLPPPPHDFVRQPTILDDFARDSALLDLDACAEHNNAGIDTRTTMAQPRLQPCSQYGRILLVSGVISKKSPQRSASLLVRCRFEVVKGRLQREAAVRTKTVSRDRERTDGESVCSERAREGARGRSRWRPATSMLRWRG